MKKLEGLSRDKLISLYINDKESLEDIAKLYKNTQNGLFLDRKYEHFLEDLEGGDGNG